MNLMDRKQKGFTLIELVMVIVILGILAAFALPRFADLGGEARVSAMKGVEGAVKSASAIVHSSCLAASGCDSSSTTHTVETSIAMTDTYPEASSGGIVLAAQVDAGTAETEDFNLDTGTGDTVLIQDRNAPTPGECQVSYKMASGDDSPTISSTTTGCDD